MLARTFAVTASLAASLAAGACGGAHAPPTESEASAAFARMQVGEARIATAEGRARDEGRPCGERSVALDEACDAAGDVCAEAAPLSDADADARCARAREACADLGRAVGAGCPDVPAAALAPRSAEIAAPAVASRAPEAGR